ncbi:hypothetical protein K7887_22480 (plasmid) [Sutcliffiella horikoshii]|uniref:hypothetical protein n=1 Tax=Sutcliffiella horikoshii TaxID=79883 RepID=UPI001CBBC348|nr:hypothetical protein [Sutcliffiella horikoshii]UAL49887.1 hypothetical protein K7887_22480 [Sutcliffiella horikoshii]
MNSSISTFMKVALTVTMIVGLLFMVGYTLVDGEVANYKGDIESTDNHGLKTGTSNPRN